MDKVNLKQEHNDKKAERKDRGDLNKEKRFKKELDLMTKPKIYGYEDLIKKRRFPRTRDELVNNDEKYTPKDNLIAKILKAEQELELKRANMEKEMAKKSKEKSAIKPKNVMKRVIKKEDLNSNRCNDKDTVKTDRPTETNVAKDDNSQDNKLCSNKRNLAQRRPVVKTVTKHGTTKTYKEISFVNKENKTTTLRVDIPITYNPITPGASTESKFKPAKTKVKSKACTNRIKYRKRGRVASPEARAAMSPPTEVAKWTAPSCLNTKSYHEAWVKSTLDAMSRSSKRNKLFQEKLHILEKFQKSLSECPLPPYGEYDEKYTGRIRVKRRS